MTAVAAKKMVPRCSRQLASKMRLYRPSTEQGTGEVLRYVSETEILEKR